jgi:hypothetical protein
MPAYFFHLDEDGSVLLDEEGTVLLDDAAARAAAVLGARSLLAGAVMEGHLPIHHKIVVADQIGQTVFSLTLGAAVGLPPAAGLAISSVR